MQDAGQSTTLCLNCRQFFGSASLEYLCSKCYRDKYKSNPPEKKTTETVKPSEGNKNGVEEAKTNANQAKETQAPAKVQADHTRCWSCNKKVGLLGFKCMCNYTYCKVHRLPEEHECTVDFIRLGKERLAKENMAIKPEKLSKI